MVCKVVFWHSFSHVLCVFGEGFVYCCVCKEEKAFFRILLALGILTVSEFFVLFLSLYLKNLYAFTFGSIWGTGIEIIDAQLW